MKKRATRLGTIYKRKATNAAKQTLYMAMWGEEAPASKRKSGGQSKGRKEPDYGWY